MAYLYRHIRLDTNQVFYIGIGSDTGRHLGKFRRAFKTTYRSKYWHNIINKTPYEVEIMLDDLTWEEACEKEKEFIKLYGRANLNLGTLVNLTDGGEGAYGIIGKINSPETRRKIGLANKGKVVSQKSKELMSRMAKGRVVSEETRRKISKSKKGTRFGGRKKPPIL